MEKRDAFECAVELMESGEPPLRYVALEVRRCLEAIVYEKIAAYGDRIPATVKRRWQPPQAFSALTQIEPEAARTTALSFAWQSELGQPSNGPYYPLGIDHRPSPKWLKETWNKLGSFLHAVSPFAPLDSMDLRSFLESVLEDLRTFVYGDVTSPLAPTESFECSLCRFRIIFNPSGAVQRGVVECLNPQCGARYFVRNGEEGLIHALDEIAGPCPNCGTEVVVPGHRAKSGLCVTCTNCRDKLVLQECWELHRNTDG